MLDRIHDKAITVWYSVPSALVLMLETGGLPSAAAVAARVFFAGEVFPMKHLRRRWRRCPHARFLNLSARPRPTSARVRVAASIPDELANSIPIGYAGCGDTR